MTMISDLPWDLVEEILSKVPISCVGKVRSTCNRWNSSSRGRILCKSETRQHYLGFMVNNYRLCSVRFDVDSAELSIKQIGQTKWIKPRSAYHRLDVYALGYDHNKNRNHKILRYLSLYKADHLMVECEIYDLKSESWKVIDVTPELDIVLEDQQSSLLKGNAYFFVQEDDEIGGLLLGFDFTKESFGQFLQLPEPHHDGTIKLSSLREEKLAVLYQDDDTFEVDIWVTSKIEPNAVLWSKLLKFNMEAGFCFFDISGFYFFIEEEKKLAVVFNFGFSDETTDTAYIIGENGYWKEVNLVQKPWRGSPYPCPVAYSSSYVPSLVQINQITGGGGS